ncbi:MAG: xylulokinase [Marmoricola sp.]|nr:xylulokinase [Marmoricola sp.]
MTLVAGVDSSTQSTKIVVCDAVTGEVVREGRAAHPDGTEVDPGHWWRAFGEASGGGLLDGVAAIGVGGQQHGMVTLDETGAVVRPALLWNDTRSAGAARSLVEELGGRSAWAEAVGSVPLAAFTVTKLRWLAEHEPGSADRTAEVVLPHDWVTARLLGGSADRVAPGSATTDRGDASGTGYWSPATGEYRTDLVERALGKQVALPRVAGPAEVVGSVDGMLVSAGSGDNMAAGLGLGIEPGDVVVSLGTSGTVFAVHDGPTSEPTGIVAGFADATGRFLPLVCTLNAARVLGALAAVLGTDLAGLDALACAATAGAGGLSLLPYLDGERTPDLPTATGTLGGITRTNATPENLARAAVEGMLCGLADGVDALLAQGLETRRVLLIGGAAGSRAVQQVAPDLFGAPVVVPAAAEYVALGAARQAAWALAAQHDESARPPSWPPAQDVVRDPVDPAAGSEVRERYRALRLAVHPGS